MIGIFVIFMLAGGLIGYRQRRHEVGRKAAGRDLRRGLSLFIVGIVIFGLLRLLPGSWEDRVWVSFELVATVVLWTSFAIWLRRKTQAGSVLLDLGRSTQHKVLLVGGALICINGLFSLLEPAGEIALKEIASGLLYLSFAVYALVLGLSHFEIRESGILCLERFVRWKQIESYEWEGENGLTLTLTLRRRFLVWRTRSLPIPARHRLNVENLLARYLQEDSSRMGD